MRYLLITLLILLTMTTASAEQMVTVPRSLLVELNNQLQEYREVSEAKADVSLKKLEIYLDHKGRVFMSDTVETTVKIKHLIYHGAMKTSGNVKIYNTKKRAFITRFGLVTGFESDTQAFRINSSVMYLSYRLFGYQRMSLEGLANFDRFGISLAHTLTPNTKVVIGPTWKYGKTMKGSTGLFLGVGFNF